jgi:TonB family protein
VTAPPSSPSNDPSSNDPGSNDTTSNDPSTPSEAPKSTSRGRRTALGGITWRHGLVAVVGAVIGVGLACSTRTSQDDSTKVALDSRSTRPDSEPVMINREMPFRYPPALYAEKVQGNVLLRLFVDTAGAVVNDSTRVVESSKVPLLDSAALSGSRELKFTPAKLRGVAMPVTILFPVYFRHPDAPPPAGDSLLKATSLPGDSAKSAKSDTTKAKAAASKSSSSDKSSDNGSSSKTTRKKKSSRRHRSE